MLFVFSVSFFLRTYGGAVVNVVAPNVVEALRLASLTENGWMLLDPHVDTPRITRGLPAHCSHDGATGNGSEYTPDRPLTKWECEDCPATWGPDADSTPSATNAGFRAYCENLAIRF